MGALVSNDECKGTRYMITRNNVETFVLIFGALFFSYWALHKILVRVFKMESVIRTTSSLQSINRSATSSATTSKNIDIPEIDIHRAMTHTLSLQLSKRLDKNNEFRIRQKGSIWFVKTMIWFAGLFCLFIVIAFDNPSWYADTFWHLNRCSVNYIYVKYQCIVVASYYCWELVMIEIYYKNSAPLYLHHWLSVVAAIYLLIGGYSPFVTNHGMNIALIWVVTFILGFRYNYCESYPNITRLLVYFCYIYYVFLVLFTTAVDILLVVRLCMIGFGDDTMPMHSAIASVLCVVAWTYDDYLLIQTLNKWRSITYENMSF
eukprot:241098_1